jgi:hypothetical protein
MEDSTTPEITDAERDRQQRTLAAMEAAGQPTTEQDFEDYFGFAEDFEYRLPDGQQFIIHRALNEGARRKYLNELNRDITVERVTGNAKVKVMQGEERFALLNSAIVGWNLFTKNKNGERIPVPFNASKLREFLEKASPAVIDLIEKEVRKHNTWLAANVTSEDIKAQIKDLQDQLDAKLEEESGKAS